MVMACGGGQSDAIICAFKSFVVRLRSPIVVTIAPGWLS